MTLREIDHAIIVKVYAGGFSDERALPIPVIDLQEISDIVARYRIDEQDVGIVIVVIIFILRAIDDDQGARRIDCNSSANLQFAINAVE